MAKHLRYAQKRISKKRLRNRKPKVDYTAIQATGTPPDVVTADAHATDTQPDAVTADALPGGDGHQRSATPPLQSELDAASEPISIMPGIYFLGLVVVVMGFLAYIFAANLTLALDIPENGVRPLAVLTGVGVAPVAFLSDIEEMEGVYAEFLEPEYIDFNQAGTQAVALNLRRGRRVGEAVTPLHVLPPVLYMQVEAGTYRSDIAPLDFVPTAHIVNSPVALEVAMHGGLPEADTLPVGEFTVSISLNGVFFESLVSVVDTTPPTAVLTDITIPMGDEVWPDDFIISVYDISPVEAAIFVYEPYVFTPGEQEVSILFEDYFGNQAVYTAVLTVLPNTIPPQIIGAADINVNLGTPIRFRQGVTAEDAFGRPLSFGVDSSDVNINALGTYSAVYYVEDAWGLRAEVTVYVHVLAVDPQRVHELANAVLDGILHEGMTQVQQALAIFDWISHNVAYAADVSRNTLYEGAYQGLRNRRGDCFVFYSISEVLLTQAGIPNMHIQRIPGQPTRHSWNLINPDGLGWHHFDTTPLRLVFGQRLNRFMFTSSDARRHTEMIQRYMGTREYYTYDPDLYPEIVQ